MRHQTKRKYADRKNLNRKYHPQKAYRKQQKRKTGWRARWDKFTDRLANIFGIDFLDGSKGSKRDWDIVQDGNVLIKNARIDEIERFNGR